MQNNQTTINAEKEHGKWLLENNPIDQWGWGSPAGKLRANRRGKLIIENAHVNNTSSILEIGCGTGLFTEMFAETGAKILAVDLSAELLAEAKKRNLNSEQVQFLETPFEVCQEQGPFDAIIGSSVLHHLQLPLAFQQIFSLLKPGGIMSFAEPNYLNPQIWFCLKFRKFFPHFSPDETAFVRWKVEKELKSIGFTNIKTVPFDWLHPATPQSLIPVVKTISSLFERIVGISEFAGSITITAQKPLNS